MQNLEQQPYHFNDIVAAFPTRTQEEIGEAIERLKKSIGSAKNREEIMELLQQELR